MIGRKLDRHVLFSFLGPFLASLVGLAVLIVLFDLFERIDECFRLLTRKGTGTGEALQIIGTYYAGRVLAFIAGYAGLACLAGGALTVAVLHRNSEITAMRAAGISVRRAFVPIVLFSALVGCGQLALSEFALRPLAPAAEDALNKIYFRVPKRHLNVTISRAARLAVWSRGEDGKEEVIWNSGKVNVTIKADEILRGGRSIKGFSAEVFPGKRIKAESARWKRGRWRLVDGQFWVYGEEKGFEDKGFVICSSLTCDITPTRIEARSEGLAGMGMDDLFEMRNDQAARVEIWQRLSLPAMNLILMLIGLPLAVLGTSRGGRLLPLGMALVLGALYVLAGELGAHVARGGDLLDLLEGMRGGDWLTAMGGPLRLAVDVAAALPHMVFLAVGIVLYWRVDR